MVQDGMDWIADQLGTYAGRTVTYRHGDSTVSVTATVGYSLLKLTDEYGNVQMVRTERDYIIATADLVLGGLEITPQRGDRITDVEGTRTNIYEVLTPAGEPVWRWSDSYRVRRRIHTKLVSST